MDKGDKVVISKGIFKDVTGIIVRETFQKEGAGNRKNVILMTSSFPIAAEYGR